MDEAVEVGRRLRRVSVMAHRLTFPTLALLAVAGSATGVYLGRAAVAEINPAYFNEPEPRFHSDLVANRPSWSSPSVYRAGQLSPAEAEQALGKGCVGCRTYPEEYYPVHDSSVDKYQPGYAEVVEAPIAEHAVYQAEAQDEGRAADFAAVERYSSYAVAEAPAQEQASGAEVELAAAQTATE